ncbi:MAG: hypothetical protein WBA83_10085 [Burkholderiaceae bacterium]
MTSPLARGAGWLGALMTLALIASRRDGQAIPGASAALTRSFSRAVAAARRRYEKVCAAHRTAPNPKYFRDLRLHDLRHEGTLGADRNGASYNGLGPLPTWLYAEEPPAPPPTLAEVRAAQLAQINNDFNIVAAALTAGYPEAERLTWPVQQTEALAWAADNTVATPYLDGLAVARGITDIEMRQLTLAQVQAFQAASQRLVGTRQRLRDEINAAATVAAVQAITWPQEE